MVRPINGLITTFITTLGRWLHGELSKYGLELSQKLLATMSRWLEGKLSKHRLELFP